MTTYDPSAPVEPVPTEPDEPAPDDQAEELPEDEPVPDEDNPEPQS